MSQGSLNQKIRFLGQMVCPVSCLRMDRQTDRQNDYCGFSFNLSSRIGPKFVVEKDEGSLLNLVQSLF